MSSKSTLRLIILFVFCWFLLPQLPGQVNRAWQEKASKPDFLKRAGQFFYYTERTFPTCCDEPLDLICVDALGQEQWRTSAGPIESNVAVALEATHDRGVVLLRHSYICDVGNTSKYTLLKFDSTGTQVFSLQVSAPSGTTPSVPMLAMAPDPAGRTYVCSTSSLIACDPYGAVDFILNTGFTNIRSVFFLNNGNLLFNAEIGGQRYNIETDTTLSLSIKNQVAENDIVVEWQQDAGGDLIGRTSNGKLHRYRSTTLQKIYSTTLSGFFVRQFLTRHDSVWVSGEDAQGVTGLSILDTTLMFKKTTSSLLNRVNTTGLAMADQYLLLVTQGGIAAGYGMEHGGLVSVTHDAIWPSFPDLELIAVSAEQVGFQSLPVVQATVTIKNNGQSSVNDFSVLHSLYQYGCNLSLLDKFTMPLAPGSTVSVVTGTFHVFASGAPKVEMAVSVPDNKHDRAIADNVLSVFVGNAEINLEPLLRVYPNPSSSQVFIETDSQSMDLHIFDLAGAERGELTRIGDNLYEWPVSVPPGMYLLELKKGNGTTVYHKLVRN